MLDVNLSGNTHQSVPFLNSAVKTQPQVRPVEQIKRIEKLSKVIQVSFTKPTSADESDTKLARSFWRDYPKNLWFGEKVKKQNQLKDFL